MTVWGIRNKKGEVRFVTRKPRKGSYFKAGYFITDEMGVKIYIPTSNPMYRGIEPSHNWIMKHSD
jgi:hypothetical protein